MTAQSSSTNALQDLLREGLSAGSEFALGKLFGSREGTESERQVETLRRGKINGSGPVNGLGALLSPKSFRDLFFGTRSADTDPAVAAAGAANPGPNPLAWIVLLSVLGLLVWFGLRKYGR